MSDRRAKPKSEADVIDAVKAWIRAEYFFRYGPHAYERQEQEWWEQAECNLRQAVAGKDHLPEAYKQIGGK